MKVGKIGVFVNIYYEKNMLKIANFLADITISWANVKMAFYKLKYSTKACKSFIEKFSYVHLYSMVMPLGKIL